jgi:hypothetical protein
MRKTVVLIIASMLSLIISEQCRAQFGNISIGKYGIESIAPESFTAIKGSVYLEVINSGEGFTVSDISGMVYKEGMPFVSGKANMFHVDKGTRKTVISGRASLCDGASLWSVLGMLFFDPEDYSVDISLKVIMDSGSVKVMSKKNMPLKELLKIN